MDAPLHIAQDIHPTANTLAELLKQCPQWSLLSPTPAAQGWDNLTYQLTHGAALRLPRRLASVDALRGELAWLPKLSKHLPLPIPKALHVGTPTTSFPYPWAVVPWIAGTPWGACNPGDEEACEAARSLARFLIALHGVELDDHAPSSAHRGGVDALQRRDIVVRAGLRTLKKSEASLNHHALLTLWQDALGSLSPTTPSWCHGDLHPFNIIADNGQLAAIIDWGDLTAGDPALDLYGLWMMFDAPARLAFRQESPHIQDAMWMRAKGWALALSLVLKHVYKKQADHPFSRMAMRSLKALSEEP